MYKILNQINSTEIFLYSLIEGGYSAAKIIDALKNISPEQPITLRINSDGGEVFEAIAIYNMLKDRNVSVIIDGVCASAATIVAMSGKSVFMKRGSMIMLHNVASYAFGDSEELKAIAETLDKITDNIISIYQTKCNLNNEELRQLMAAETWLNAELAKGYGFIDDFETVSLNDALDTKYEDGVRAERERLEALDALYTPGRAAIIDRAKYQTFQNAKDIAIEILTAEQKLTPVINGISLPPEHKDLDAINSFTDLVTRKRGY